MVAHGMIQGNAAGTYHLLPMAVRSLQKLRWIVDTYMQAVGAQKVEATCIAPKQQWKATGQL